MKKQILTILGGVFTAGLLMVTSCTPDNNNNGGQNVTFDGNSYNFCNQLFIEPFLVVFPWGY